MRPVLVLLNGVPASGKSTLARRWCERSGNALPLALDLDVLRGMLGGWRGARIEAGLAARAMAVAAVRTHLRTGHDVVVPQYLERPGFIVELAAVAERSGAAFLECALLIDHDRALERFASRSAAASARALEDLEGGLDRPMPAVHEAFERFLASRPAAVRLDPDGPDPLGRLDLAVARARVAPGERAAQGS